MVKRACMHRIYDKYVRNYTKIHYTKIHLKAINFNLTVNQAASFDIIKEAS